MKSYMRMQKDENGVQFYGVIRWDEWPKLDRVDSMLIQDCGGKERNAADWLLALEVIFRRALEQSQPQRESK